MAVGALSMLVPMFNAELAPPGIRGSLVALQQLAITFGIMVSYWIGYGTVSIHVFTATDVVELHWWHNLRLCEQHWPVDCCLVRLSLSTLPQRLH